MSAIATSSSTMLAPRDRGAARGRVSRGRSGSSSSASWRGKGSSGSNNTGNGQPSTGVWTRGQRGDRGVRGNTRGQNNARAGKSDGGAGRGGAETTNIFSAIASSNSIFSRADDNVNSTPFAQDDYKNRLNHIREVRPKQRAAFIQQGRMNPEGQMRLSDSVKLVGICTDMCPEYERVRRIVEDDVKPPECTPETEHLPRKQRIPDESRMVKAYARSAAGMDVELISEIRSPATCLKSLDYLMERLDNDDFEFLHSWIWDRSRAIRKDLRTQRIEKRPDINILLTCLERSARFLLLSAHQMSQTTNPDYSHQQDIEQLNQTLMSLQERYSDNRRAAIPSNNEAEFWAYRLILAPLYTSNQLENELHRLPSDLRHNDRVKTAIEIYQAFKSVLITKSLYFVQAQANWKRFWAIVKSNSTSYLMACAAEISFNRVRHVVLDTIWRAYRQGTSRKVVTVDDWTTDKLRGVLGLDTDSEAVKLCELHGFQFNKKETGETFLDISQKGYSNQPLSAATEASPQIFSQNIVEVKRRNRSYSAVVQGLTIPQARASGYIFESEQMDQEGSEIGSSLFVPDSMASTSNIFSQQLKGNSGGSKILNASANPFLPRGKPPTVPATNPFLPQGNPPAAAPPNASLEAAKKLPQPQFLSGATTNPKPGGTFDSANNAIKLAPATTSSSPISGLGTSSLFKPSTPSPLSNPPTTSDSTTARNPFANFVVASTTPKSTPVNDIAPTASFTFPSLKLSETSARDAASLASTFTPAGSPTQLDQVSQKAAELKIKEEQLKAKLEEERKQKAEAVRKRVEQERQIAEQERHRAEAEEAARKIKEEEERAAWLQHQQQQLKEEEERRIQEARERLEKEKQARAVRLQDKQSALDALTVDVMFDPEEGLMLQFIENMVKNVTKECAIQVEKENSERLVDERFEARRLGLLHAAMAFWVAKTEKKKRAQQARKRRIRLREQKAQATGMEEKDFEDASSAGGSVQPSDTVDEIIAVRQSAAPQSTRRAKRTEERLAARASQAQLEGQSVPTPVVPSKSTNSGGPLLNTSVVEPSYSAAYRSTAPIDRTETDWFALRALGIDPSKQRKRSFDSGSGSEEQEVIGPKRPKMLPPSTPVKKVESRLQLAPSSALDEQLARFRTVQEAFRKSTSPSNSVNGINVRSSQSEKIYKLMAKARELVAHSPKTNGTSTAIQHDFGRSVPNLMASVTSSYGKSLAKSSRAVCNDSRPAYWARKSRFVPRELYGQGPDAIRAYNAKYKSQSPAMSRFVSAKPIADSSHSPTQFSYVPLKGNAMSSAVLESGTQAFEQLHRDTENEQVLITDNEAKYDGDSDEAQASHQSYYPFQQTLYDEPDEDSGVADQNYSSEEHEHGQVQYGQGHFEEQFGEEYDEEEEDEEEEEEEEEEEGGRGYTEDEDGYEEDNTQHFAQPAQRFAQLGNTEADAIELSD